MWYEYQNISAETLKVAGLQIGPGHYFVCPSTIGGFLLKQRQFGGHSFQFSLSIGSVYTNYSSGLMKIEHIEPCSPDKGAVKSLQIPVERLSMITALTHKYEDRGKTWSADFIQEKGEGQIFLLHGPSGVGKTYTAECIAKYTGKQSFLEMNEWQQLITIQGALFCLLLLPILVG